MAAAISALHEDPVSAQANWRSRVKVEMTTMKNWQNEYGYLADGHDKASQKQMEAFKARGVPHTMVGLNVKDDVRQRVEAARGSSADSLEDFMATYMVRKGHRPAPREQYARPVLTSHQYGWSGNNLERFGQLALRLR